MLLLTYIFVSGLSSIDYPTTKDKSQTNYEHKPSYIGQNIYPTGYPQTPNVPTNYEAQQPNTYPAYLSPGYSVPPSPNGPLSSYPQPNPGYTEYFELYPGQNQIYDGNPEYSLYPTSGNQYPYNGNVYGYPEEQFTYPVTEKRPKKPQVTTPVPSAVSTQSSTYVSKSSSQTPSETKPSPIDIRINVPDLPENKDGLKTIVVNKNDILTPSTGSSGYPSSLTPQYIANPTKAQSKTPYQSGQESNLVKLSSSNPESSTPLYSPSTKTPSRPKSSNYVEPSSTAFYREETTTLSPDSSTPVNVIPYPLPIVPNPGSCPCYFVPPTNNSTNQPQQQQQTFDLNNLPEGAVIGFIPIVFYPSCGTASKEVLSSKLEPVFPTAYQVPYKCSYCEQSESQTATIRNSFNQVLKQSQLSPSAVIRSPSRKNYLNAPIFDQQEFGKRIRVVKRKSRDEQ